MRYLKQVKNRSKEKRTYTSKINMMSYENLPEIYSDDDDEWEPDMRYTCEDCYVGKPIYEFDYEKENGAKNAFCNKCMYNRHKKFDYKCVKCEKQYNKYAFLLKDDGEYNRICKVCCGCTFRRCNRCPFEDLTTEEFDKHKRTGDYLKTCKKCMIYLRAHAKEKYKNNKEEIREQLDNLAVIHKEKYESIFECECGSKMKYRSKGSHFRTQKHQAYLETLKK